MVDPSAVSRRILLHLAQASGGKPVFEAPSAEQALVTIDGPLDLVVTEWSLPEMGGLELIAQLRGRPENNGMKAVLLTTRSAREDVLRAQREGIDAYVLRPFSAATLRSKLAGLMRPPDSAVPDAPPADGASPAAEAPSAPADEAPAAPRQAA